MNCTADALLQDLGTLVEDLKVVSYKWLARQYKIPSNFAKQVLYRYVQEQGTNVKAIFLVSGYLKVTRGWLVVQSGLTDVWLVTSDAGDYANCCKHSLTAGSDFAAKDDTSEHVLRLVDGSHLQEAQGEFASLTGVHVHSVMPAERTPITDAGRLCAEDAVQARQFYQSIVKHNALSHGSADVFAINAISNVSFTADIDIQQQQQQQGNVGLAQGRKSHATLAVRSPAAPAAAAAAAAAEPSSKRQKTSPAAAAAGGPTTSAHPNTTEEVGIDDEPEQQPDQQQQEIGDSAAAGNGLSGGAVAAAGGSGSGVGLQQGQPGASSSAAAGGSGRATGRGGSGRGGVRAGGRGGAGSGKAQTNIMSFFGKR